MGKWMASPKLWGKPLHSSTKQQVNSDPPSLIEETEEGQMITLTQDNESSLNLSTSDSLYYFTAKSSVSSLDRNDYTEKAIVKAAEARIFEALNALDESKLKVERHGLLMGHDPRLLSN
jgi:hypothetical protein